MFVKGEEIQDEVGQTQTEVSLNSVDPPWQEWQCQEELE